MIASYRHRFIFLKGKKTGGSSVECALATQCGPDDIVTPRGIGEVILEGGAPRNFTSNPETLAYHEWATREGDDVALSRSVEVDRRVREDGGFFAHMTAKEVRSRIGPQFWDSAYRFTVERHPYEKAVSQAFFRWGRIDQTALDFSEFFDAAVRTGAYGNLRFYTIDGAPVLDRVLRFERLEDDLSEVADHLGLRLKCPLPRLKSEYRTDRRPAREMLTDDQKAAIYEKCRGEFEIMGYDR